MVLPLANVINISVSESGQGVGEYNTSNIGLFTHEAPGESFGTDGFALYKGPSQVAADFGTDSLTYKMAVAIFSQRPNILANGGYLAIIPFLAEKQTVTMSVPPTTGAFKLNYGGNPTADINFNDAASVVQTKLRALTGLENVVVTGSIAGGLTIEFAGVYGDIALLTVSNSTLDATATVAQARAGEALNAALLRTKDMVQYFGVMGTQIFSQAEMLAAAATIQSLNKIAFFVSKTAADVEVGGMLDLLRSGSYSKSRGLFYGSSGASDALLFMAAYAGRGLSTNFAGSNTTQTMHLKDLATIQPDASMTQTLLSKCQAAGADVYISLQGVAKTFTSGKNQFFDHVYNTEWFVGALEVAGFNLLAQSSTKITQTDEGMSVLKGAYRKVCEQAIRNQFGAPGSWTSPATFGDLADLVANIEQRGYYIYSAPVALQSQADREARKAPLVQIALKSAGAMHSSDVIVNVNK